MSQSDSIRITDQTPEAVAPMSATFEADTAAANAVLAGVDHGQDEPAAPARALRSENIAYAVEHRVGDGPWKNLFTSAAIRDKDEVRDLIADLEELTTEPGVEYQVVELRHTETVLPRQDAPQAPADAGDGPVKARKLRSGDRVDLYGEVRLVWKVAHHRFGNSLRIHTVPPQGENPDYFMFTQGPDQTVELISRGPAVTVTGQPPTTVH